MTKTKRQLRAEAVERLREMGGDIPSARILKALYPLYNPFFDDDNLHMLRDALIDLLTDEEPPEGDVKLSEPSGKLSDCSGTAAARTSQVPESDTREKLEADLNAWCIELWDSDAVSGFQTANLVKREVWEFLYRQAAITERECSDAFRDYRVRKLGITGLADLQAELEATRRERDDCADDADRAEAALKRERAQREHWQRVADKHAAEMQQLRKQLDAQLPEDVAWPRFEDGELVRYGDKCAAGRVQSIQFFNPKYSPQLSITGVDTEKRVVLEKGERVKRPPLIAADGKPIEVGQVLYGESDGKAWTVDRIDCGQPHSVIAHCGDSERRLKPRWLTHEEPDSAKRIMSDHTREVCDIIEAEGGFIPDTFAIATRSYIDRIEKLAKEGA